MLEGQKVARNIVWIACTSSAMDCCEVWDRLIVLKWTYWRIQNLLSFVVCLMEKWRGKMQLGDTYTEKRKANVIEMEERLQEKGLLGDHSPTAPLYTWMGRTSLSGVEMSTGAFDMSLVKSRWSVEWLSCCLILYVCELMLLHFPVGCKPTYLRILVTGSVLVQEVSYQKETCHWVSLLARNHISANHIKWNYSYHFLIVSDP